MKENRLIMIIVILIIIIVIGAIGIIAFVNSQNSNETNLIINNSTNESNKNDASVEKSIDSNSDKYFCEKCNMWVLESERESHTIQYHQFTCEICGKKVWEDGSHVDGSPYHSNEEYGELDREKGYNQYAEN
ncbi:hypothetical protein [Methanobrevibacter sp.]|mgnify:CR=1 FL=1|uniref:hypothetical protein n=1 Tax=Methanobrevibacter sp. TaxID=66852 RepID=UPI0026376BCD|nr:hypothetical protein [uncultured Methanobrevibacter sp.]